MTRPVGVSSRHRRSATCDRDHGARHRTANGVLHATFAVVWLVTQVAPIDTIATPPVEAQSWQVEVSVPGAASPSRMVPYWRSAPAAVWTGAAVNAAVSSAIVGASTCPSGRTHGSPTGRRAVPASVEVERNATTAPVHPAVAASLAHSASAAARPPPWVKALEVTNASRPG